MVFRRPAGPWRPTRRDALDDAIATGNGERDPYSRVTYLTVPAWIQEAKAAD